MKLIHTFRLSAVLALVFACALAHAEIEIQDGPPRAIHVTQSEDLRLNCEQGWGRAPQLKFAVIQGERYEFDHVEECFTLQKVWKHRKKVGIRSVTFSVKTNHWGDDVVVSVDFHRE